MPDATTLDEFADMLARLRDEAREDRDLLVAIHDNVLAAEAEESFARAKAIPVADETARRRARGRGRLVALRREDGRRSGEFGRATRKRRAYGKRGDQTIGPLDLRFLGGKKRGGINYGAAGMEAAFTDPAGSGNPAKLFDLRHGSLIWGTRRWLTWTSFHMQVTAPTGTRFMPARIDFATGASAQAIEEGVRAETEEWIFDCMVRAGAPEDWLQAQLPEAA